MSAELETLPGADTEVLGPPLDGDAARKLDGRIRRMATATGEHFANLGDLIDEAKHGQVHIALGFPSWSAYLADALAGLLELTGDARREAVALMAGEGMSLRAIGQATGVSKDTVARDLAVAGDQVSHDETPDEVERDVPRPSIPSATVTGKDGKTYTRRKPTTSQKPKPDPFPVAFEHKADDVHKAALKLAALMNGKRVSDAERSRLGDGLPSRPRDCDPDQGPRAVPSGTPAAETAQQRRADKRDQRERQQRRRPANYGDRHELSTGPSQVPRQQTSPTV